MDGRLWQDTSGIRRFSDKKIQAEIDAALANVPKDKTALVVEGDIDGNGVRGIAAFQMGNGWSIGVIGEIDAKKDWAAGFRVSKVW
jgi:hypothetical protein